MKVLVLGYGGPLSSVVGRWRVKVAVDTLRHAGGGSMVVSGHDGEAERLAELAPPDIRVLLETTARSTWENVELSLPLLEGADKIAIASDYFHARRAAHYLCALRPELASRVVPAHRRWPRGAWMDLAGAVDVVWRGLRSSSQLR